MGYFCGRESLYVKCNHPGSRVLVVGDTGFLGSWMVRRCEIPKLKSWVQGWELNLDTPGILQLKYMKDLFVTRKWYDLIPDQNHTVMTSGYSAFSCFLGMASTLFGKNQSGGLHADHPYDHRQHVKTRKPSDSPMVRPHEWQIHRREGLPVRERGEQAIYAFSSQQIW